MAARLNTRFIVILLVVVAAGALLIGGFAYLRLRADATRHVRQGDELMAEKEYTRAFSAYGRAVSKEPGNIAFVDKALEALTKLVPETRSEARERFQMYLQLLDKRITIASTNADAHRALMIVRHDIARLEGSNESWARLREVADRMAGALDEGDPARLDALMYRAIGDLARAEILEPTQFESAMRDLRTVIAARPSDDLSRATLLGALAGDIGRRRLANRNDPLLAGRSEAFRTETAAAVAAAPKGPLVASQELEDLLRRRTDGDKSITDAMVGAVAQRLLDNLENVTEGWMFDRALTPILVSASPLRNEQAAEIVAKYIEKHPNEVFPRQARMTALVFANKDADARQEAEAILAMKQLPIGIDAMVQPELRAVAATTLFDIEFGLLETAPPDEREKLRPAVEAALQRLRAERDRPDTDLRVIRGEARLAVALGRWTEAVSKYEQFIRSTGEGGAPPDMLYEAAVAASRANDLGLARKRLDQTVARAPRFVDALILKARVEHQSGDLERARRTLADVRAIVPDDERVMEIDALLRRGDDEVGKQLLTAQSHFERGDAAGARTILSQLQQRDPDDIRIIRALAYLELISGNREVAVQIAVAGLEKHPDDDFLKKIKVIAETSDPVERIVEGVKVDVPEGNERTLRTLIALSRASFEQRAIADALAARGRPDDAMRLRENSELLDAASLRYRELMRAIDPPPPTVLLLDFERAMLLGKLQEAAQIVEREMSREPAILSPVERASIQARLLVQRADVEFKLDPPQRRRLLDEAQRLLAQAVDRNPESTELRVVQGQVQQRLGNTAGAVDSFEAAYGQRPNDMRIVEAYAAALLQGGETGRVLDVLRNASRLPDVTPSVRALWLDAEAVYGDRRIAVVERRAIQQAVPEDLGNGVALATLLLSVAPTRELIIDARNLPRITEERWLGMSPEAQRAALDGLKRELLDEAEKLLIALATKHPGSFEVASLRSDLARSRGTPEKGEKALRDAIATAGDKADARMYLSLGTYLYSIGKPKESQEAFEHAVKIQSPAREADRAVGRLANQRRDFTSAAAHLTAVADVSTDPADRLAAIEATARAGKLDEADAALKKLVDASGIDGDVAMMQATLLSLRLEAASAAGGNTSELPALTKKLVDALTRAREARPADPAPLVALAQITVADWQRKPGHKPDDKMLDDAMSQLDKAIALRADSWPASRLRAQIMNLRGDATRARLEVERLLKVSPLNDEARHGLIELWMQSRGLDKAVAVAREGVDLRPIDPKAHRTLGDLLDRSGDLTGAVAAHRRAFELEPGGTPDRLVMLMLKDAPGHRSEFKGVVELIEGRPEIIDRSLYLRAAYGAALANFGRRNEGLEQIKLSYIDYGKKMGDRGDLINGWYDQLWLVFPLDKTAEAEQFVRTLAGDKLSPFDQRELGLRWGDTGPTGEAKTIDLLQQAVAGSTSATPELQAMLHFDLGTALYLRKKCTEAAEVFDRGLKLHPDNPGMLNNFAYLCDDCLKDPTRALPFAERAVVLFPNEASFQDTLGWILYHLWQKNGDARALELAEQHLKTSLSIARSPETHLHLAEVHWAANRAAEAKVEIRRAIEIDPKFKDNPELKKLEEKLGR